MLIIMTMPMAVAMVRKLSVLRRLVFGPQLEYTHASSCMCSRLAAPKHRLGERSTRARPEAREGVHLVDEHAPVDGAEVVGPVLEECEELHLGGLQEGRAGGVVPRRV